MNTNLLLTVHAGLTFGARLERQDIPAAIQGELQEESSAVSRALAVKLCAFLA
jgi:hypothetical protein